MPRDYIVQEATPEKVIEPRKGREEPQKLYHRWEQRHHMLSLDHDRRNNSHTHPEGRGSSKKEVNEESTSAPLKKKNPLSARILDGGIPCSLGKTPKRQDYIGDNYPKDHVEHMDGRLDYYHVYGDIKCKLSALTLTGFSRD